GRAGGCRVGGGSAGGSIRGRSRGCGQQAGSLRERSRQFSRIHAAFALAFSGRLGCASWFTFSWKDCALAAAAAGATAGATGAGRFNTRTSVRIEIARVAKLMMRCSFTKRPPAVAVLSVAAFHGTRGARQV